jgi:hypothetical protein
MLRFFGVGTVNRRSHSTDAQVDAFKNSVPRQLLSRLPERLQSVKGAWYWYDHIFGSQNMLRLRSPQICSICIRVHGYTKAAWDLSLSTICLEHRCHLIDECPVCCQQLRWGRPSTEFGNCNHYLGSANAELVSNSALIEIQSTLESLFARQQLSRDAWCASICRDVSLDAWLGLVQAFGLIVEHEQIDNPSLYSRFRPSAARRRALRAYSRMRDYITMPPFELPKLALVVAKTPLLQLIQHPVQDYDRQVVCDVYLNLFGERALNAALRTRLRRSQLTLF